MFARVFNIRAAFCLFWLLAVGTGFALILDHQNIGGRTGVTPTRWPAKAQITFDPRRDTLVMFAHPQCPCTRASMEELNRLLAQSQGRVTAQVYFLTPGKAYEDWTNTDLWRSATTIPGITVHEDPNGAQARLFGAETSGDVLLYDRRGLLMFQGGITDSRGHVGDNAGESSIISFLAGREAGLKKTPVYGCSLLNEVNMQRGIAR